MPRTPDSFPGTRIEESLILEATSSLPEVEGEMRYISGTGEFQFKDSLGVFNPRTSGSVSGSGISEAQHETLDTLVHSVEENSYEEVIYFGTPARISNVITWTDVGKSTKIREQTYTYSGIRVFEIIESQFDALGDILYAVTESISYMGQTNRITSVSRTRNDY